ncbi:MAG: hypothetical protein RMJ19_10445 [Gemmatales bacterium]|nr:hypothetical protein [Gemmatales bacterium]MCS7160878.1 hypothetical protein [Gemmatales bacterium]MDW8176080.1 hypothetical protein [Gemmatales bacterium]MDW8222603.1 hypothetical protein [Gemmatales bacterium]
MTGNGYSAPPPQFSGRDRWLLSFLNGSLALGLVVFLIVSTQGWALWFFAVIGGLGILGAVHYVLWGRAMEREVRAERERLQREELAQRQAVQPPAGWSRRF